MGVSSSYKLIGPLIAIAGSDWQALIQGEKRNKNMLYNGKFVLDTLYFIYILCILHVYV